MLATEDEQLKSKDKKKSLKNEEKDEESGLDMKKNEE